MKLFLLSTLFILDQLLKAWQVPAALSLVREVVPKNWNRLVFYQTRGAQHTRPSLLLHLSSQFEYSEAHKSLEDAENLTNLQIQSKSKVGNSNIICDRITHLSDPVSELNNANNAIVLSPQPPTKLTYKQGPTIPQTVLKLSWVAHGPFPNKYENSLIVALFCIKFIHLLFCQRFVSISATISC